MDAHIASKTGVQQGVNIQNSAAQSLVGVDGANIHFAHVMDARTCREETFSLVKPYPRQLPQPKYQTTGMTIDVAAHTSSLMETLLDVKNPLIVVQNGDGVVIKRVIAIQAQIFQTEKHFHAK